MDEHKAMKFGNHSSVMKHMLDNKKRKIKYSAKREFLKNLKFTSKIFIENIFIQDFNDAETNNRLKIHNKSIVKI